MSELLTKPVRERTLTTFDRCDRCGAQAYTTWFKAKVNALLQLCKHHADEHGPALLDKDFELTADERWLLDEED